MQDCPIFLVNCRISILEWPGVKSSDNPTHYDFVAGYLSVPTQHSLVTVEYIVYDYSVW